MSKDEKEKVESNYTLLDKGNLSQSEYDEYVKDYPALEKENICKLNTKDKDIINELNPIMGKAMIVVGGIEEKGLQGVMGNSNLTGASDNSKANMKESAPKEGKIQGMPANTDPFFMIKNMPEAQKNDMLKQINGKFESMPESMITQTAATFRHEYRENTKPIHTKNWRNNDSFSLWKYDCSSISNINSRESGSRIWKKSS